MNKSNKIKEIILMIEKTSSLFYQNKMNEGYFELEKLITYISDTMNELFQTHIINADEKNILNILKSAMDAMEQKDTLLLADILEYELKEIYLEIEANKY